jgi:hypothetical protein
LDVPFVSNAQRRYLFAKHPDIAHEFAAATPKGAKLPEHVKHAHALGTADALDRLGFHEEARSWRATAHLKSAGEELRLKIPARTFHGFEAAKKTVSKNAGNGVDADGLAQMFDSLQVPKTPGDETRATDPLSRTPAWGAPSNLAGGDAGNRISDMGQPTQFGGV